VIGTLALFGFLWFIYKLHCDGPVDPPSHVRTTWQPEASIPEISLAPSQPVEHFRRAK
jgi:hypothetical protein